MADDSRVQISSEQRTERRRRGGGDQCAVWTATRDCVSGANIAGAGSIATLNADISPMVRCGAGATSPSCEVLTVQHWFALCAGGCGHSLEQHSSARALSIAARHEVRPPPSSSATTTSIVANRRITIRPKLDRILLTATRQRKIIADLRCCSMCAITHRGSISRARERSAPSAGLLLMDGLGYLFDIKPTAYEDSNGL
jgi:hypothetical protein